MIKYKSAEEIAAIRQAGRILRQALNLVAEHCRPGVRTEEMDSLAYYLNAVLTGELQPKEYN